MPRTRRRCAGDEEAQHRADRDQHHGEEPAERGGAPARIEEQPQRDRDRHLVDVGEVDELREEVVVDVDEGEDRGRHQRRHRQRHDDAPVALPVARPVDDRRLFELRRQRAHELHHEEDEERVVREELRHHQRQDGVHPADLEKEDVLRDQLDVDRQHDRAQHQREPQPFELEVEAREGIGGHRAGDEVADHRQRADHERVHEEQREGLAAEEVPAGDVVLEASRSSG